MAVHGAAEASIHDPSIQSVPADVLFSHKAGYVLGDVRALRTGSRALRTGAAVVVAGASRSASLRLPYDVSNDHMRWVQLWAARASSPST